MGKGFALVHWIQTKRSEILKCQLIPEKYRRENAVVNLKCRHKLSGVSETRLAKIVKIEQTKAELHNITIDTETGTIIQMSANKLPKNTVKKSETLTKKLLKRKESKKKKKKAVKHKKSKHIDDNSDSDESSSSESSSEESANEPEDDSDGDDAGAMKSLLSCVTSDSIKFVRKLLPLMERAYEKKQQKNERQKEIIIEDSDPIAIVEPEPENLQSLLEGFLPPMTIAAIFHRCQDRNDWKKITTDILVEIYGKQLAHLSAKGSRGAQGIDPAVYRTVYDLINMRLGWILPAKEFVRHVNKVCSNRKKAQRLKMMNNPPAETWSEVQVKLELPSTSTHGEPQQPTPSGSSSVPSYQQYMTKAMEDGSKPIITSVRSIADSGSSVPSSSIDGVANPYPEYVPEQASSQMENNEASSHYLGEFLN